MPRWGGAMARFSRGGLASKSGLHAVLGRRQSSVTASLAHRDRVVAADLRVAKGGGGGHDLRAARRWGLARLEGRDMGVGIMWWRGGGVEDPACGVKRVSVTLVKKRKKHIFTCVPAMVAAGLARFEGRRTVERWGFEDPACGEMRSLQHWSEKKRKKEEKKNI